jgi:hypothetical protein
MESSSGTVGNTYNITLDNVLLPDPVPFSKWWMFGVFVAIGLFIIIRIKFFK